MAGQIIVVNGASGAGKSTTCKTFADRSDDFWLLFGIDHFTSSIFPTKFGHHGPRAREGIFAPPVDDKDPDGPLRWNFGEKGWQAFHAFHEWVAAASRQGCNIIIDHLMMIDPPVLQDVIWRLAGLPVLFVCVKPPIEVLAQRVETRPYDKPNPAEKLFGAEGARRAIERLNRLRPWFYQAVYANDIYDLEVNTVEHGPDAVCDLIEQRLAQGPGTAFDRLRERYPQDRTRETPGETAMATTGGAGR